jgi:hypothetical protein
MKNFRAKASFGLMAMICSAILNVSSLAAYAEDDKEDATVRPGNGFGIVKLGMDRKQLTSTLGKRDGSYSMPNGIQVEYSQWKDPNITSTIRVFFDNKGKVIQLSGENSTLVTENGLSGSSSLTDVLKKYPQLERFKYRAKATRIDYYDNIKAGIAFEFAWADVDGESKKRMCAILVHKPGMRVIADSGERLLH